MKPMAGVQGIARWAGLELSRAGCFALGMGFGVEIKDGLITDCLPELEVARGLARTMGLKTEEFSTVARSKARQEIAQRLARGVVLLLHWDSQTLLLKGMECENVLIEGQESVEIDQLIDRVFAPGGPVKLWLLHYRKTKHIPPMELASKKALSGVARRFLFPKKPFRGVKAGNFFSGQLSWGHEPGLGHKMLAEFLEEAKKPHLASMAAQTARAWQELKPENLQDLLQQTKALMQRLL